ncbi:MAG: CDP-glycerol glycerophosphotransferase family protein [Homoserinimonas sp.]
MPLGDDLRAATRVLRNGWRSMRARNRLAATPGAFEHPPPNSVKIAVYYSDGNVNLYQLRQWYAPLLELSKTWPVVVIARSPGAMVRLLEECPLPVVYLRKIVDLENFVLEQELAMALYVNQNARNLQMFRYGRMWHVFINHGESDKAYMSSNQHKAYDYSFVAGLAARDRLRHALWGYDVDTRTFMVGRPQADHFAGDPPYPPDDRTVVLYAPTWEGDRSSMSYGSVASHGVELTRILLDDPTYRLIYRPHPRSGVVDARYHKANQQIISAIRNANAADLDAHHVYDDGGAIGWQLVAADVAITDVSAMVYDRLATGKPILVTRPVSPEAEIDDSGYLGACEWLTADGARDVTSHIHAVLGNPDARDRLQGWVERYFGDTTPGAATQSLHDAVARLIAEWERHSRIHAGEPRMREPDPFVEEAEQEEGLPAT